MKTVHLISGGDAGGARTHVLRLLGELNKTGQAQLLCLGGGVLADDARERGIPCETLTGGFFAQLRAAKRYIRSGGFDLVRCHGSRANLTAALLRPSLGVPSERIFEGVPLVNNTSVTLLRFENDTFSVLYVNDTTHLPAPPYTPFRENGKAGGPRCYDLRSRPFEPDAGQERYIACYRDAWRGAHGTTEGFNASACWLSAQLHSAEAPGCITEALVENEFAGILTLDERRGRERGIGWIAFLYVVPELRGHHCGIQLVGTAAMRFRQLGRRAMRLTVAPENPALGFYEKAGFVRIGTEAGALGDLLVMEWTL